MKIVIRAFNEHGYHRDILTANENQVLMNDGRITEPRESCMTGLIGFGGRIDPKDFPEMTYFEVVIRDK